MQGTLPPIPLADVLHAVLSQQNAIPLDPLHAALIGHLPQGVVVYDAHGAVLLVNPAAQQLLGELLEPSAAWGSSRFGFFLDGGKERVVKLPVERALEGIPDTLECFARNRAFPRGVWVRITGRPLSGGHGAFCIVENMSRERQDKAAREASAQLYRVLFERNVAGIIRSSLDGSIMECNRAWATMLGLANREQVREYRAADFYEDPAVRDELIAGVLRGGDVVREARLKRVDGQVISVLMNTTLLDQANREFGGELLTTIVDISERKRWEQSLRESEERFSAFMRNLPGVAFVKNSAGRYLFLNEAAQKLVHNNAASPGSMEHVDWWPSEVAERLQENDRTVLETGKSHQFIEALPQPEGTRSLLVSKFPIRNGEGELLVGGIGIDITERQSLEERLQQSEKMEAIGRLAGGVAHDFNNLLTLVSGYCRMAIDALGTHPAAAQVVPYLEEVMTASSRATSLTGQLLAFSRRQVVQPRPIDLHDVVGDAEKMLSRSIGEHIHLQVHTPPEPCTVLADPGQIEQVLVNIALNARDAMPDGGHLRIETKNLTRPALAEPSGPCVLLEIEDDGKGMDEITRARLFEPFFSSKEAGKTRGLGLATAYGIVRQSGGEIVVSSEVGAGSCFSIYLPRIDSSEMLAPLSSIEQRDPGGRVILLVEDERAVRELVKTMLTNLGYSVLAAEGGAEALRISREKDRKIDLLLTDVIMPHMNGRDLAIRLLQQRPDLHVIFMSGYTDDMLARQGVLAEGVVLIQKPFSPETLARVVARQLHSKSQN